MNRLFYKEIIKKTNKNKIYFFFIHSGNFSNDFDSDYKYKIVVLNGSLRVISDDKKMKVIIPQIILLKLVVERYLNCKIFLPIL